jgi:hypothetical protein
MGTDLRQGLVRPNRSQISLPLTDQLVDAFLLLLPCEDALFDLVVMGNYGIHKRAYDTGKAFDWFFN